MAIGQSPSPADHAALTGDKTTANALDLKLADRFVVFGENPDIDTEFSTDSAQLSYRFPNQRLLLVFSLLSPITDIAPGIVKKVFNLPAPALTSPTVGRRHHLTIGQY
jgi:hypothetical protein